MTRQGLISTSEMELIGAYMDGALSEKERADFSARLQAEPQLRALLTEQRQLRKVYRSLPVRKVPRNFTLTTLEARQIKRKGLWAPVFGYGSLASMLMLVTLFFSGMLMPPAAAPSADLAAAPAESIPMAVKEAPMAPEAATMSLPAESSAALEAETGAKIYMINWKGVPGFGTAHSTGGLRGMGGGMLTGIGGGRDAAVPAMPASSNLQHATANILGPRPALPAEDLDAIFSAQAAPETELSTRSSAEAAPAPEELSSEPAPEELSAALAPEPTMPADLEPTITPIPEPLPLPTEAAALEQGSMPANFPAHPIIFGLRLDEGGQVIGSSPSPAPVFTAAPLTASEPVTEALPQTAALEASNESAGFPAWYMVALPALGLLSLLLGGLWLFLRKH